MPWKPLFWASKVMIAKDAKISKRNRSTIKGNGIRKSKVLDKAGAFPEKLPERPIAKIAATIPKSHRSNGEPRSLWC